MGRPLKDQQFRKFLVFWGFLAFVVNLGRPFAVPFVKTELGFPSSFATYASAGLAGGMVLSCLPWGKLADRVGNRLVFLAGILIMAAAFVVLAATPEYAQQQWVAAGAGACSFVLCGVAIGALGIAHTVRRMNEAPAAYRGPYMCMFFLVNGVVAGVVSISSGAFLDTLPTTMMVAGHEILTLRIFFSVVAVLVLCALPFLRWLPRVLEPSIREVIRGFSATVAPVLAARWTADNNK